MQSLFFTIEYRDESCASASINTLTPLSRHRSLTIFRAPSSFCLPMPGPITRESTSGSHFRNAEAEPGVSFASGSGNTIKSGLRALIDPALIFETANKTRSAPFLAAAFKLKKALHEISGFHQPQREPRCLPC